MPKTAWDYLNSPLIAGINSSLLQAIVGSLMVALIVGVTLVWLSSRWEEQRQRHQVQLAAFKAFHDATSDWIVRSADVYALRGTVNADEFRREARQLAYRRLILLQTDAEHAGVFKDQSLFGDLQEVKTFSQEVFNAITQQPEKAPINVLETASGAPVAAQNGERTPTAQLRQNFGDAASRTSEQRSGVS